MVFEGKGSWDERMEHVGKHLEKVGGGAAAGNGASSKADAITHREIAEGVDGDLLQWSLREGIVEEKVGGGWRLCGVADKMGGSQSSAMAGGGSGFGMVGIKREYDGE